MADNIERVGLVFNENGSADFIKSLQLVNSNLKENYENFKLTQVQWDKSTTATQKLKDKLEYLNNAYDIQKSKINVLKNELYELENAENKNEVAISKKRAQLTQAEASLQRYQNQIDSTTVKLKTNSEQIKEYGQNLENTGNKINQAGNKVSAFSVASIAALTAATKSSIDFESAFTGVEKTVDATDEELEQLKKDIRNMSKEIPASTTEISAVAEAAGQLGIKTNDIMSFTRTMIDLGNSTNLSAEEAASSLAKFANVTKMNTKEYSNLGSTIVALGNNFATTEKDIVEMATNLAATGELTGLTQSQILALATSMSSVGIEAQAGGSAMSKLLKQIQTATEVGGDSLEKFSRVAGVTSDEFKQAFEKDAVKALTMFISGLNDTERNGKSAIAILDDMGLSEVRLSNTILSLANSSDLMNNAVNLANKSWKDNNALNKEASKRYDTLESKIKKSTNKLKDIGVTVGNKVMPIVEKFLDKLDSWSKKFENLNDEQIETIAKIGLFVGALGPALKIIGNITSASGKLIKVFGSVKESLGSLSAKVGGTGTALNGLKVLISGITSPTGLATTAILGLTTALTVLSQKDFSKKIVDLSKNVTSQINDWEDLKKVTQETLSYNTEITNIQLLVDELNKITDENGKIKKGYEERANYITNELSAATGVEINLGNNIIQNYKDIQSEIDKVIEKKKAEAILSSYSQMYATATAQQAEATQRLAEIETERNEILDKMQNTENKRDLLHLKVQLDSLNDSYRRQSNLISEYGYTIQNYENLNKAVISGTTEEITNAINTINVPFQQFKENQSKTLKEQLQDQNNYLNTLNTLLSNAVAAQDKNSQYILKNQIEIATKQRDELMNQLGLTNDEIDRSFSIFGEKTKAGAEDIVNIFGNNLTLPQEVTKQLDGVEVEIYKDGSGGEGTVPSAILKYGGSINNSFGNSIDLQGIIKQEMTNSGTEIDNDTENVTATQGLSKEMNSAMEVNLNISGIVDQEMENTCTKIAGNTTVPNAANELSGEINNSLSSQVNGDLWGQDVVGEISKGLKNKSKLQSLVDACNSVATKIKNILGFSLPEEGPLSDFDESMPDMIDLMIEGLKKNSPKLEKETKNIAQKMEDNLNSSPSINLSTNKDFSEKSQSNNISEDVLYRCILKALNNCKISMDRDSFIKFIDNRLLEVM